MFPDIFATEKNVIAMVHFAPLPGSPLFDSELGVSGILENASRDAETLVRAGFDGLLFCNEGDRLYQKRVGPETVATMAHCISRITEGLKVPFGVDVLWDMRAALSIAKATGAKYVRGLLTGVYGTDMGLLEPDGAEILRFRKFIEATDIKLLVNINPEFGGALPARPIELCAKSAVFIGLADALCVSGPMTGMETTVEDLKKVKMATPNTPVVCNTGASKDNIAERLNVADAVIVGTSLKKDGLTWNPVDEDRAREFMQFVRKLR
jgi:membrane complex biogenesis BtpA family protein